MSIAHSNRVFDWPEFIALTKRLGIDLDATTKLVLTFAEDGVVQIEHHKLGRDEVTPQEREKS